MRDVFSKIVGKFQQKNMYCVLQINGSKNMKFETEIKKVFFLWVRLTMNGRRIFSYVSESLGLFHTSTLPLFPLWLSLSFSEVYPLSLGGMYSLIFLMLSCSLSKSLNCNHFIDSLLYCVSLFYFFQLLSLFF